MSSEIWARLTASKLAHGAPVTKTLRSIYLDTPEHALNKAGIALRLRRDGRRWIQGVKTRGTLHGGLSQVGELENPAPGGRLCLDAISDASIREEIVDRVNGAPLQPICETVITRRTSELMLSDGTRAELALDTGEVRAGDRSAELSELEIELLAGNASGLFDIAQHPASRWRVAVLSAFQGRARLFVGPRGANRSAACAPQRSKYSARPGANRRASGA